MLQYVFRDLMMTILLSLVAIVMISNQTPPVDQQSLPPPGNLIVTITWPQGNSDVDLWLMAPGEKLPVGYSNKDGEVWNLLRDDTGLGLNDVGLNYENAYSRGLPEGEYIVNIHAYRVETFPFPVKIEVSINHNGKTVNIPLPASTLNFARPGEELTAIRFKLDKDGNVVPGSVFNIFQPLRNGTK